MSKNNEIMEQMREEARQGIFKLPLVKPIRSGTKEIQVLDFDLSKLTGEDMIECETQWAMQYGRTAQVAAQTASFQLIVAARAAGVPVQDLIKGLTLKESIAVCNCVVSFLIS